MPYVDGFVVPVPKKNLAAYRALARKSGKIWMEYGALQFRECLADQLDIPDPEGNTTSPFPTAMKLKRGETLFFSYIVYKSRKHRDQVNAKVMADARLAKMMEGEDTPFDVKRMLYGGFKTLVDL
jgi:uncharacterized protein YbaA (DUF1428 family)